MRGKRVVFVMVALAASAAAFPVAAREPDADGAWSESAVPAAGTPPERSEADLMMEALTAEHVEAPSAAQIARLVAQVKAEARSAKRAAALAAARSWKDPFADNPNRPIPLGREVRLATQLAAARREIARARAEAALARADAATARAQAARARAGALAARRDADRAGCASPALAERPAAWSSGGAGYDEARRERLHRVAVHRARLIKTTLAQNERRDAGDSRERSVRLERSPAGGGNAPGPSNESPVSAGPGMSSQDPRGIVIVPINSAASPAPAARAR